MGAWRTWVRNLLSLSPQVGIVTGEAAYARDAERYGAHPEILAKRVATEGYR